MSWTPGQRRRHAPALDEAVRANATVRPAATIDVIDLPARTGRPRPWSTPTMVQALCGGCAGPARPGRCSRAPARRGRRSAAAWRAGCGWARSSARSRCSMPASAWRAGATGGPRPASSTPRACAPAPRPGRAARTRTRRSLPARRTRAGSAGQTGSTALPSMAASVGSRPTPRAWSRRCASCRPRSRTGTPRPALIAPEPAAGGLRKVRACRSLGCARPAIPFRNP